MNAAAHHFIRLLCWFKDLLSSPIRSRTAEDACCSKEPPSVPRLSLKKPTRHGHFYQFPHWTREIKTMHGCRCGRTLAPNRSLWVCTGYKTLHLCPIGFSFCSSFRPFHHLAFVFSFQPPLRTRSWEHKIKRSVARFKRLEAHESSKCSRHSPEGRLRPRCSAVRSWWRQERRAWLSDLRVLSKTCGPSGCPAIAWLASPRWRSFCCWSWSQK